MTRQFYARIVLIAVALMVAQSITFGLIWSTMVSYAVEHGRTQRGGVGIGITFYFGSYFLMLASFIASVLAGSIRHPVVRWITVLSCLGVWFLWFYPSLAQYPVRIPAFTAAGALTLLLGSGVLMPYLAQRLRIREGLAIAYKKANKPCVATGDNVPI
jgi:hypothetical protein